MPFLADGLLQYLRVPLDSPLFVLVCVSCFQELEVLGSMMAFEFCFSGCEFCSWILKFCFRKKAVVMSECSIETVSHVPSYDGRAVKSLSEHVDNASTFSGSL
jgi:hypothetical protein